MSRAYTYGTFFSRNNVMYRAIADIAAGTAWSSLVAGTHYQQVTAGALNALTNGMVILENGNYYVITTD
jgi:hypothetical protein